MKSELRVPALPESVADATVLTWHRQPGETVRKEESLVDLETDKVVLEVPAPVDGVLGDWLVQEGAVVSADTLLAEIEIGEAAAIPAPSSERSASPAPPVRPAPPAQSAPTAQPPIAANEPIMAPAARRLVRELALDPSAIPGSGRDGRVHKADVMAWLDLQETAAPVRDPELRAIPAAPAPDDEELIAPTAPVQPSLTGEAGRPEQRVPMTRMRARIAERLVEAQRNSAMLTTFNEVDMQAVMTLRAQYKARFEQTHRVRLGLMSFFVKATVEALQRFPVLNASADDGDIVYHGYYDIGIAVSSPRGLVVPILRNCDQLAMADIEHGIVDFSAKANDGTLSFEELTGGTFSITNGGVFGSLMSTPILNPPQSAILGLHRIQERPIAVDGAVVIRPMMYLALSYDHRIVDGREAVQFLVSVKEIIEDPARLLLRI